MVASPEIRGYVARAAGIPASEIAVDTPLWTQLQRIQQWATGEKRANQIIGEGDPYRITLDNNFDAPVIDVVTQAPTANAAARLANGVVVALTTYVLRHPDRGRVPDPRVATTSASLLPSP